MLNNAETFLQVYKDVFSGEAVAPRGQVCKEVCDYKFTLDMRHSPLTSFRARGLNLNYAKEEFKWYLRGDKFDDSIEKHATMWQKIKQPDGSYFSNYGQYIFPHQIRFVINELTMDRNSRRASIVLLNERHLFIENKDVVCTYAINFRIRNNQLDMTVMMRSNDVIFGTTNDVFCFAMLYRMVYALLANIIPLSVGKYTHFANSLHVYQRHFDMIGKLIIDGMEGYQSILVPWPTTDEAEMMLLDPSKAEGPLTRWLNAKS